MTTQKRDWDWQISVSHALDITNEQAEALAGRAFTRDGEDDDSFEIALEEGARKALKDRGSWLSMMVANTDPEVEAA